ncbi:hypothetical protein BDV96DRAFT_369776 [Lophiotrema nucula]|uniref:Poly [ADP-ribose] polymerase n=1 Tax=Lophiotrema nucula TaxID=690887 RepID=A0A6A5ZHS8_9PLEO|nr:hypothetical protein BDV96DRAFT_369776 [Lophiotrema nucula]
MSSTVLTTTADRGSSLGKRFASPFSKKSIFGGQKQSDEWHQQVDFSAHALRPSDKRFPWPILEKHTDNYLKKKGKLSQTDVDIRLALLIETHDALDVAVAACAHAMSAQSLRALLNVELNVKPASYYGLEMYLQCLIAANHCNPTSVTDVEAEWATKLLPYATHGVGAAGRYLEGLCEALKGSNIPNLSVLPDFSILARRAMKDFASQLEGMKLRCQWLTAYNCIAWMQTLAKNSPVVTPPGHLLPEHVLDAQFPIWRVWSSWRPNLIRIMNLDSMDSTKRGVLPDLLCLEGPDFIGGRNATLRDGLVAQYGAAKRLVRFRSLVIEVPGCAKKELGDLLHRTASLLESSLKGGNNLFKLFVQLTIARPIRLESLQIIEATIKFPDALQGPISEAILELYTTQSKIGGQHFSSLCLLVVTLDDDRAETLREVLLRPWLVQGIEMCLRECQTAVRTHIDSGLAWTHLALELYGLSHTLKNSVHCLPLLNATIRAQLDVLPLAEDLRIIFEIYEATGGHTTGSFSNSNNVKASLEAWYIDRLIKRGFLKPDPSMPVDSLLWFWRTTTNSERRRLALFISKELQDAEIRRECFDHMHDLTDQFVSEFLAIIDERWMKPEESCIKFAKLLSGADLGRTTHCFKSILYNQLNDLGDHLLDHTLHDMKAWVWAHWILNLNIIFADFVTNTKIFKPSLLGLKLHKWTQQLSEYLPTLTRLEEHLGDHHVAVQCILKGGEGLWEGDLVEILKSLDSVSEWPAEKLMQTIVGQLSCKGKNACAISACCRALLETSEEGLGACQRILDSVHGESVPKVVAEIMVAGYLQDEDIMENDKSAIVSLTFLLSLDLYETQIPNDKLREAAKYYEKLEEEIVKEADRLEGITKALKARDPRGTAIFLEQLGIQDVNPLDEELESLPVGVIDAVEKRGPNEIEISFPLASFTDLERAAMGIGSAKTLLLRMCIDYSTDMPANFCTHLDTEDDFGEEHTPWVCFDGAGEPDKQFCRGRCTALTWQLNRILHRCLTTNEDIGIADLYDFVTQRLLVLPHCCVVCGMSHSAKQATLRRSIPCQSSSCTAKWNKTPLEVRIPEIRSDPFAVDILLTGVYAAAMSGRMELLPGCPIKTTQQVIALLNKLPPLSVLQKATSPTAELIIAAKEDNRAAEQLLSWACTHYRGFVASASGLCKIPGLPTGTHQFVLANASPSLESAFAAKLPRYNPTTRVLFHGTSLDRLPSILSQGLRTLSGTHLQRTGAAHGKGIYMAEDPATSFSYSPSAVSWRNSGLNNMRVLLGCEVVGNGRSVSGGIHVITDERSVMLRYIFLFTPSAYSPNANHITTPMLSAMTALRVGSV